MLLNTQTCLQSGRKFDKILGLPANLTGGKRLYKIKETKLVVNFCVSAITQALKFRFSLNKKSRLYRIIILLRNLHKIKGYQHARLRITKNLNHSDVDLQYIVGYNSNKYCLKLCMVLRNKKKQ